MLQERAADNRKKHEAVSGIPNEQDKEKEMGMEYNYDYEEMLAEKEREIRKLESDLEKCQMEIRRLHRVCRENGELLNKFPIQELFRIFNEHDGKGSYSVARLSITNGGYDLWFQIYEDGIAKIECRDGEVSVCGKMDVDAEQIIQCILGMLGQLRLEEA